MPHAVHLFLEQVSHGLWDNAWFYINGPHVLQAGPQADEAALAKAIAAGEDERSLALRPFRELQLDTLSFPEYSEDFPHVPMTLGFTGRPGGPDFYINKVDNTIAHGPGGQFHHELAEYADSCFAKVVSGFDSLKAMTETPTVMEANEYQFFYEEPIHIVKVAMVPNPFKPKEPESPQLPEEAISAVGETTAGAAADTTSKILEQLKNRRQEMGSGTAAAQEKRDANSDNTEEVRAQERDVNSGGTAEGVQQEDPIAAANNRRQRGHRRMFKNSIENMVEP